MSIIPALFLLLVLFMSMDAFLKIKRLEVGRNLTEA